MKKCSKCRMEKELEEFYRDKSRKDGLSHRCKNCAKKHNEENAEKIVKYRKEYRKKNKERLKKYIKENEEKIKEYRKEYFKNNKTKLSEQSKKYREMNREKLNQQRREYDRERRKNNPQFRVAKNLRRRTNRGIISKGGVKSASTEELLGCSFEEANAYIESLFEDGMSWENYGEWEIDHIKPLAAFTDLTDPEQQRQCYHYSNLRPLWMEENRSKSSFFNGMRY